MFPLKDPVLVFAVVAVIILTAPLLMARYRMPGMIGLLLAGAVLGPNALGILQRDSSFTLFGTVGLIYIMFAAALELDLAVFKKYGLYSLVFGVLTFSFPQGIGTAVGYYVLRMEWPAAILFGSIFASHTLLAYPIASRLGIAQSRSVATAVGGTMLADTTALLVLAVIAGMTRGDVGPGFGQKLFISISVYVAAILFGLPRLGRWFFLRNRGDGVREFVFVLAAVFTCAGAAHMAGLEPIIGAFLAGLALNRLIPHSSTLMNRLNFTGEAIFIPFFLLSVGMLLDVRIFVNGLNSWLVAFSMVVVVMVGKWLGAQSTRFVLRFDRSETNVIFGLSLAQAAATLATTMVGLEIGLFDETIVNGAIMTILVSCVMAPWLVDRHGPQVAANQKATEGKRKAPDKDRVVVQLSSPASMQNLLDLTMALRDPLNTDPVFPLVIVEDTGDTGTQVANAEKLAALAGRYLSAANVPNDPTVRLESGLSTGLARVRRELRATETVLGWPADVTTGQPAMDLLQALSGNDTCLLTRLIHPINVTECVSVVLPLNAEADPGVVRCLSRVRRLAQSTGARVRVVSDNANLERMRPTLKNLLGDSVELRGLESWEQIRQGLADTLGQHDLLAICTVRDGSQASYPFGTGSGTGFIDELAAHFTGINLIVMTGPSPAPTD